MKSLERHPLLCSDGAFQKNICPMSSGAEQWLQRHAEAGSFELIGMGADAGAGKGAAREIER